MILPERVLSKMSREDRARLDLGPTKAEAIAKCEARSEKELQEQIAKYCELKGWWFDCPRMDKKSTVKKGRPDFLICVNGRFVALECKVGNNKPTIEQAIELRRIADAGGFACVVRTAKEAIDFLLRVATTQPTGGQAQ